MAEDRTSSYADRAKSREAELRQGQATLLHLYNGRATVIPTLEFLAAWCERNGRSADREAVQGAVDRLTLLRDARTKDPS